MRAAVFRFSFSSQDLLFLSSSSSLYPYASRRFASSPFLFRRRWFAISFRPPPPRIPRSTVDSMAQDAEVFVGAIDQGTTSSRFLIFNKEGEPVAEHQEVCT